MTELTPAIDVWMLPATPEVARRAYSPDEIAHVFHGYKRSQFLDGVSLDETIQDMDQAGVKIGLLTAFVTPFGGVTNQDVAEICVQEPGRFAGVASVDPRDVVGALDALEHAVSTLGFVALRIEPFLWEMEPTDRRLYPLYARCAQLGIPVCLQIGNTGSRWSSESGRPLHLDRIALDFPSLSIVGGHIGWPWTEEAIAICWKHNNIYLDTSAHLPRNFPPSFVQFLKGAGRGKIMWGTDYPLLDLVRTRKQVGELFLDPAIEQAFLNDTAARVFGLES